MYQFTLWSLSAPDAQDMAQEIIGRELSSQELGQVTKSLEDGLGAVWADIMEQSIRDATRLSE